ncbi:alkaline phosphatase family protein [Clostridium sp. Marseille-QA1073]
MNKEKNKYLIVISFDALSAKDYHIIKDLPNFKMLLEEGSYIKEVETIYPSLTYPAHTTIITGKYPCNHGIINNTLLQPGRYSPDWYWYRNYIQGDTLYDLAKKERMTTAALLWPVTGKANIDYNLPEIFANRWYENQILVSLLNGSPMFLLDINNKFGKLRKGLSQPELDDFVLASSKYLIEKKKPNLLLIHFTDLDTQRHYYGYNSKEAIDSINRHEHRLSEIINSLKKAGIYEEATIVVLGDHSALDEDKIININVEFKNQGLINVDNTGKILSYDAYLKSCDGSAYIYLKDKNNTSIKKKVEKILLDIKNNYDNCIEEILSQEEAENLGADRNCDFMIEAKEGYYFLEKVDGEIVETVNHSLSSNSTHYNIASHGYSPKKKDYSTIFMAYGKGIKSKVILEKGRLIDEGPTLAKLLGLELINSDGVPIEEILE